MKSIEEIFLEYGNTVYKYLLAICRDKDLAEELSQETFYQAIKSINRFDEKSKLSTWLCAIAKNVYFTYLRKNRNIVDYDINDIIDENIKSKSTEEIVVNNFSKIDILKAINKLSSPQKDVLYLRLFGDLSFREIGDILEENENWARVTYYRSKLLVRKELENE